SRVGARRRQHAEPVSRWCRAMATRRWRRGAACQASRGRPRPVPGSRARQVSYAPVLFGRDAELVAIEEVLASARAGRGRALFVTGEAGIGKSSLLAEARARACPQGSPSTVLDGAAWESPGAPPYWPWIQVLRAAEQRF